MNVQVVIIAQAMVVVAYAGINTKDVMAVSVSTDTTPRFLFVRGARTFGGEDNLNSTIFDIAGCCI